MDIIQECLQLIDMGQVEEGIKFLKNAMKKADDEVKFEGAIVLLELGHLEDSQTILEELHELYPDQNTILSVLMQVYFLSGNDDGAFEALERALPNEEGYVDILLTLADYYFGNGLQEVSEQKLIEAYDLAPNEPSVLYALSEYYTQLQDPIMAIHYLKKLKEVDPQLSDNDYHLNIATLYTSIGLYEEALPHFEKVSRSNEDDNPDFHLYYGACLYALERFEACIPMFLRAIELEKDNGQPYIYIAKSMVEMNDISGALEFLKENYSRFEGNNEALQLYARLLMDTQNYALAKPIVELLLQMDEENVESIIQYTWILEYEQDFNTLIEFTSKQIQDGVEIPELFWVQAKAFEEIEEFEKALNCYDTAYTYLQDQFEFLMDYGRFLVEEGNQHLAIEIFNKARTIDPTNEEANERIHALEGL